MDSRERTFLALEHQEPDRVPLDFWASIGTKTKIKSRMKLSYNDLLDHYDIDMLYIEGPTYIGPPLKKNSDTHVDIWGVPRKSVKLTLNDGFNTCTETYKEVIESPLEDFTSIEAINDYVHWPSPDWFDYGVIEKQCDQIREQGRVVAFMGDRLNRFAQLKPAMYIRGVEQIFLDMVENPEIVQTIFGHITTFYMEYERRILEAALGKIDILVTGDDFGAQKTTLISPAMWERFLKKGFTDYIKLAKNYGARVMHHSCGSVYNIMEKIISSGLDILQSLQPEAAYMDPGILKKEFGDRISFQGGISIQKTLPFGKPDDIKEHVRAVFEKFMPGGGYIACTAHNIQIDTSIENILTLLDAYHTYGLYCKTV